MMLKKLVKCNPLFFLSVAAFFLNVGCSNSTPKGADHSGGDSSVVSTDTVKTADQSLLKIKSVTIYDNKGRLLYTDEFRYDEHNRLISTNGGATAISYNLENKEQFITVKTNGCAYTYVYNPAGDLYLLNQKGRDWSMNLNIELEQGKLKKVRTQEKGLSEEATWQNDNMWTYTQSDEDETSTLTYTYGELENRFGFDIVGYLACTENRIPYMNVRFLAKEALSKNLPTVITSKLESVGTKPVVEKYELKYELDADGRVKTIIVTGKNRYELTYSE